MKKNMISMIVATLLIAGLAACGGKQSNSTNECENSTEETTPQREHPFLVIFLISMVIN